MPEIENNGYQSASYWVREAFRGFETEAPLTLVDYMPKHFYLSKESSGVSGEWVNLPYQLGILHAIGSDDIRKVVFMKPSRVGLSKIITGALGWTIAHKKRTVIVYTPTKTDSDNFNSDQVVPMLRDCPYVGSKLKCRDPYAKSPFNKTNRKEFDDALLYLLPSQSPVNFQGYTADSVYHDEIDRAPANVGNEGDPIFLGSNRMTQSSFPKQVIGSSPTLTGSSLVESEFLACKQQFRRYVRCTRCGEIQVMKFGDKDSHFGLRFTFDDIDNNDVFYRCEHCRGRIEYSELPEIDAAGCWQSADLIINDETGKFEDFQGVTRRTPNEVGFHMTSMNSYFLSWRELATEFYKAKCKADNGVMNSMITFKNTRLAETYEPEYQVKVDSHWLQERAEDYGCQVPMDAVAITIGVDFQKRWVQWEAIAYGPGYESWGIATGKIHGNFQNDEDIRDQLQEVLNQRFIHESGYPMRAAMCMLDIGYGIDSVVQFCRRDISRYIAIKGGSEGRTQPIVTYPRKAKDLSVMVKKYGCILATIGTDNAKDTWNVRYQIAETGPGHCHFPKYKQYDTDFYKGLVIENQERVYRKGQPVLRWVCPEGGRNEPTDCRNYSLASILMLEQQGLVDLNKPIEYRETKKVPIDMSNFQRLGSLMNGAR